MNVTYLANFGGIDPEEHEFLIIKDFPLFAMAQSAFHY